MHHQDGLAVGHLVQGHRPVTQPVEQLRAVGCGEQLVQRVVAVRLPHACRYGQQVQVVVAQQAADGRAQTHHAAQHCQRLRTPVHQVAQREQGVATR